MSIETGIMIRALVNGKWTTVDLGDDRLPTETAVDWLRSKGGYNPFAENLLLALISKDQIAHEIPFIVDVGEATYEHEGNHLSITCHDEGITLMTACDGDATSCDVPIVDVRVYNALIQLIRGVQVHYEEKNPHRDPPGLIASQDNPSNPPSV